MAHRTTTRLADLVALRPWPARSANVELSGLGDLEAYVPTGRTLDVVERLSGAMAGSARTRAWSITGPYGSGKSSLALFLAALASPASTDLRTIADAKLRHHDPELFDRMATARARVGIDESGCIKAIGTADHGPVLSALSRALLHGILEFGSESSSAVRLTAILRDLVENPSGQDATSVFLDCLRSAARLAPVLLIIDELGQALQYAAENRRTGDFFVLQQVAERASADHGSPVFFFTLQHLSFVDYLGAVGEAERREWGKVRGRFEDVPFIESHDHTQALIGRTLEVRHTQESRDPVRRWAAGTWDVLGSLGLQPEFGGGVDAIANVFPLHPLTVLALPELCATYAQHERTLFSYLASGEPGSVATFIKNESTGTTRPWISLDHAYDYFIHSIRATSSEVAGSRWLEIDRRIRETHGLGADDVALLKVIGVLNLISQGGIVRASRSLVAYASGEPDTPPQIERINEQLARLTDLGILTYRSFADEFRIWRGSDFNVARAVADERAQLEAEPRAATVAIALELEPVIAVRHSQVKGIYRYFAAQFVDETRPIELQPGSSGTVAYWVGDGAPTVDSSHSSVVLHAPDVMPLVEASLETAALRRVLERRGDRDLDWVAQQELAERLVEGRNRARVAFARIFDLNNPSVGVSHFGHSPVPRGRRISRIVSDVCDQIYSAAPEIRSEMLSRSTMTTQAARARRDLLEALVSREGDPRFGIDGYGPERALYEAVFNFGRLHREVGDSWAIVSPDATSTFFAAWSAVSRAVSSTPPWRSVADLEDELEQPPLGVPRSVSPILVAAFLAHHSDEIGLFQDGSFLPALTADAIERLLKIPSRFQVRDFRAAGAGTTDVLSALRRHLGIGELQSRGRRNASVLAVVAPLLGTLRLLPAYTVSTKRLPKQTLAVRECLMEAREPDRLLFHDLPAAVGIPLDEPWTGELAEIYATRLAESIWEMRGAYRRLLSRTSRNLAAAMGLAADADVRQTLGPRCVILIDRELEPRLRSMVTAIAGDSLEDEEWIASVGLAVSSRAPATWTDADEDRAAIEMIRLGRMFHDAEVLSFAAAPSEDGGPVRLVTVTASDGTQVSRVMRLEGDEQPDLAHLNSVMAGVVPASERTVQMALALLGEVLAREEASRVAVENQE